MHIIAETDRLLLRRFTLEDAAFIFQLVNDPSWIAFIGDRNVHSVADAEKFLVTWAFARYEKHGFGPFLVMLKATQEKIGASGLFTRDYFDEPDLGFALLPKFTGQGYAFESAQAVLDFAKRNLAYDRIGAFTTTDNLASIRLLEKLGFQFEKHFELEGDKMNLYVIKN